MAILFHVIVFIDIAAECQVSRKITAKCKAKGKALAATKGKAEGKAQGKAQGQAQGIVEAKGKAKGKSFAGRHMPKKPEKVAEFKFIQEHWGTCVLAEDMTADKYWATMKDIIKHQQKTHKMTKMTSDEACQFAWDEFQKTQMEKPKKKLKNQKEE